MIRFSTAHALLFNILKNNYTIDSYPHAVEICVSFNQQGEGACPVESV